MRHSALSLRFPSLGLGPLVWVARGVYVTGFSVALVAENLLFTVSS